MAVKATLLCGCTGCYALQLVRQPCIVPLGGQRCSAGVSVLAGCMLSASGGKVSAVQRGRCHSFDADACAHMRMHAHVHARAFACTHMCARPAAPARRRAGLLVDAVEALCRLPDRPAAARRPRRPARSLGARRARLRQPAASSVSSAAACASPICAACTCAAAAAVAGEGASGAVGGVPAGVGVRACGPQEVEAELFDSLGALYAAGGEEMGGGHARTLARVAHIVHVRVVLACVVRARVGRARIARARTVRVPTEMVRIGRARRHVHAAGACARSHWKPKYEPKYGFRVLPGMCTCVTGRAQTCVTTYVPTATKVSTPTVRGVSVPCAQCVDVSTPTVRGVSVPCAQSVEVSTPTVRGVSVPCAQSVDVCPTRDEAAWFPMTQ
eukprot:366547-Chlamydomonas_euryale.AAC.6